MIVLSPGQVEPNGQISLFYDEAEEPPDPDDYPSLEPYHQAWDEWERKFPHLVSFVKGMSDEVDDQPTELQVGDRFRYICTGRVYTLVNIRPGKPKPYTFKAESNGDKFSCRHWEAVLERDTAIVELISEHSQGIAGDRQQVVLERDTIPEQKTAVPEQLQWVETYCPSKRKDNHYYRYCYKEQGKIKHRHIPGGNIRSNAAQRRKQEIEQAISRGEFPSSVEKLIKSWRTSVKDPQ